MDLPSSSSTVIMHNMATASAGHVGPTSLHGVHEV